jgi:hypothetical protein
MSRVIEDRSVVLFHVMPQRKEKGRPSRSESDAPAKAWAALNLGLAQQGASVVPQDLAAAAAAAAAAAPPAVRSPLLTSGGATAAAAAAANPAATRTPPRGFVPGLGNISSVDGIELPWCRVNQNG